MSVPCVRGCGRETNNRDGVCALCSINEHMGIYDVDPLKEKETEEMPKGMKQCPQCHGNIGGSAKTCSCGHVFVKKGTAPEKPKIQDVIKKYQDKNPVPETASVSIETLREMKLKYEAKAVIIGELIVEFQQYD